MKNSFIVKGIREIQEVKEWFENQVGERTAKTESKSGFDKYVVSFEKLSKWKTRKQNSTFWALIDCFWQSGCSSFYSYSAMAEHYYRIAGLITIKTKVILEQSTKLKLYKVIEANGFQDWEKKQIYKLLKGEYEKHLSWSMVKKDKATLTIDTLMHNMDDAKVSTAKYEEILRGMDKIF